MQYWTHKNWHEKTSQLGLVTQSITFPFNQKKLLLKVIHFFSFDKKIIYWIWFEPLTVLGEHTIQFGLLWHQNQTRSIILIWKNFWTVLDRLRLMIESYTTIYNNLVWCSPWFIDFNFFFYINIFLRKNFSLRITKYNNS